MKSTGIHSTNYQLDVLTWNRTSHLLDASLEVSISYRRWANLFSRDQAYSVEDAFQSYYTPAYMPASGCILSGKDQLSHKLYVSVGFALYGR